MIDTAPLLKGATWGRAGVFDQDAEPTRCKPQTLDPRLRSFLIHKKFDSYENKSIQRAPAPPVRIPAAFLLCGRKADTPEMKNEVQYLNNFSKPQSVSRFNEISSGRYKGLYNKRRKNDGDKYFEGKVEPTPPDHADKNPEYNDKKTYRYILKETKDKKDCN